MDRNSLTKTEKADLLKVIRECLWYQMTFWETLQKETVDLATVARHSGAVFFMIVVLVKSRCLDTGQHSDTNDTETVQFARLPSNTPSTKRVSLSID